MDWARHQRLLSVHSSAAAAPRVTTDDDALRGAHTFLRDEDADALGEHASWEDKLAARYYARLFKEYAIGDLSRAPLLGLRWRTEAEVVHGVGQFTCGVKGCASTDGLASFELPFAYTEHGEEKLALVKIRACPDCAVKLEKCRKKRRREREKEPAASEGALKELRDRDDAAALDALLSGMLS